MLPGLRQRHRAVATATPAWRSLHSAANTKVVGEDQRAVTGAPAFALWRGMYFTQLLSPSTRWSVRGLDSHLAQRPRRERARAEAHDDARGVGVGATQPRSRCAADRTPGPDLRILSCRSAS